METGVGRRDFLKVSGLSAAALGTAVAAGEETASAAVAPAPATKFPKIGAITRYSPQKLEFFTAAGYEGVVLTKDDFMDADKLTDSQIDGIIAASRNSGCRIISLDFMGNYNHIDPDPAKRRASIQSFIRVLELGHRLGCKFVGTFSGGIPGATFERQAQELADVFNEHFLPVCEKLDMTMGWENYPTGNNFATVPAAWHAVFSRVQSRRLGLEFDPSHLVRQYIDPIRTAWEFKDRILAAHAKDTEIIEPVLHQVGIHGKGWWRYRIPGQGLIDWPAFLTVLLQIGFNGGIAVEHEDEFWDAPPSNNAPEFPQARKDGFILAHRYLGQFLPGRLEASGAAEMP
jgi:sugar phosphate isomerase/epimerase